MAGKTQTSLRLDADKLFEARAILTGLGLNFSEAVNIFTHQIVARRGLPFDVTLPNDATLKAMQDVREQKNIEPVTLDALKDEFQHS